MVLIEACTRAGGEPVANVPLALDHVSQPTVVKALQLIPAAPTFSRWNERVPGSNGPPILPLAI